MQTVCISSHPVGCRTRNPELGSGSTNTDTTVRGVFWGPHRGVALCSKVVVSAEQQTLPNLTTKMKVTQNDFTIFLFSL